MMRKPMPVRMDRETITFARRDVEALYEAMEDAEARAAYASSRDEEKLPAGTVRRLATGESPVRVFRDLRGLSGAQLAQRVGMSASYLSEIENGRKPGSAAALRNLARALMVEIDDLIA